MAIYWIHTSDVHGHLDALRGIEERISELRAEYGSANFILTDGGDCLQGSPLVYYHNYIDVESPHIVAETMNRMKYDCAAVGNHDIEVGHKVFDRAFGEMRFSVLCGNIKTLSPALPRYGEGGDKRSYQSYFEPYTIIEKGGMRIAVLSFITPDTTKWISPSQYEGMEFMDVKESARRWIDYIKEHEQYDMLVALCHIGWTDVKPLVEEIQDFDLVLYGHDHHSRVERVGRTLCAAPSALGTSFVELEIEAPPNLPIREEFEVTALIRETTAMHSIYNPSPYGGDGGGLDSWLDEVLGSVDTDLNEFDSYFGPSAFLTLTHKLQLAATGAQISLAAPISYDAFIPHGPIRNRDVFRLYDRDSQLYTMRFTLEEIRGILEYSYSLWANVMTSPDDHALLLDYVLDGGTRLGLKNFTINFLSAYGIDYTVDLTKTYGKRIKTLSPSLPRYGEAVGKRSNQIECNPDGSHLPITGEGQGERVFVAINSYHANGGGEILTRGTGLTHSQLQERVVKVEPYDLRQCLANEIKKLGDIHLTGANNWRFVPEEWAKTALERDRAILLL